MMLLPQTAPIMQPELTVTLTYKLPITPGCNPFTTIQEFLASLQHPDMKPQALKASVMHSKTETVLSSDSTAKVLIMDKRNRSKEKAAKKRKQK